MKIGILGTGMVGETLGSALIARGHDVEMGSRTATNEKAAAWAEKAGARASFGTFADAAAFGEVVILCTNGGGAVEAAKAAAPGLSGKLLIDVTTSKAPSAYGSSSAFSTARLTSPTSASSLRAACT